jgi:hypothetical protein
VVAAVVAVVGVRIVSRLPNVADCGREERVVEVDGSGGPGQLLIALVVVLLTAPEIKAFIHVKVR